MSRITELHPVALLAMSVGLGVGSLAPAPTAFAQVTVPVVGEGGTGAGKGDTGVGKGDTGVVQASGFLTPPDLGLYWLSATGDIRQVAADGAEVIESTRAARKDAIDAIPMSRLNDSARERIEAIGKRPTLFRHLAKQTIRCDQELFVCLVRKPEVLVGIWELMGITQVQTKRIDTYRLQAVDGAGTECTVDLVYGDPSVHVYLAEGFYEGKLTPQKISGKGLFILRTKQKVDGDGHSLVEGSLDCFLQIEQVAADLILRTFGPLIGRAADHNYSETARFIDQIGINSRRNPQGVESLALKLPQVSEPVRSEFISSVRTAGRRYEAKLDEEYATPVKFKR
jgi:hypothetical protein